MGTAHRPAKGDRCFHRRQSRLRIPLRQALRGQQEGPRRWSLHGRKPVCRTALLGVDENDGLIDNIAESKLGFGEKQDFAETILDNLKTSGVQQAHKEDRLSFSAIRPWPGDFVCAEGTYVEGNPDSGPQRRAGIFIGPEFGTVSRPDLVQAVREAADADFDVLVACAFNYDAHASEFNKLGRVPVLKARMNADLHMADDLKNTGRGNLFVIFGEPDIDILESEDDLIQVRVNGVDVFHPNTGEIHSDTTDGIACWVYRH